MPADSANVKMKPLKKLTDKQWRDTIVALTFFGIFVSFVGVYEGNFNIIKVGGVIALVGVVGGFILNYLFGIKAVPLRNDSKSPSYE